MYKMVVEITKETWGKFDIKTLIFHNQEEKINELWRKMSDIGTQLGHSNIVDVALKKIRNYYGKKTEDITEEEKQKYKAYFKGKEGVFVIEDRCKLPEAIKLRKKLGYNHDDMRRNTIAEKTITLFPNENLRLIKNLITGNQKFDLKIMILLLKLMKEIRKIKTQKMKKKQKECLKSIILKSNFEI